MLGGVSVNDISILLIVTVIAVYIFASFDKDEMRHINIKSRHVIYGTLASAVFFRLIFDILFMINNCYHKDLKPYTTQIAKINGASVEVVIDSITFTKSIQQEDIERASIGDTIELQVGKGCMGYYAIGEEYKIIFSGKKNHQAENIATNKKPRRYSKEERAANEIRVANEKEKKEAESKAEYIEKLNNRIADFEFKNEIYNSMQQVTCQHKDMKGDMSIAFRVEGRTNKTITDIIIINNTKKKIDKTIHDFIEQSELLKKLDNGIYIFEMKINRGFLDEKFIKKLKKTKEDFEELLFMYLYKAMPCVKGLRGSAFIDITIQPDNTISKAVVTQSLNPKVDKIALECAKRIPWTANMDDGEAREKHFRLTIMYAYDKLWKVKIWNMDY